MDAAAGREAGQVKTETLVPHDTTPVFFDTRQQAQGENQREETDEA
jgi:hypothetical protein